jgi:signal transduction histidine kinase
VTQQNAALVEEAASAALSFEEEAARLVDVVGAFKLDRMEDRDHAVALVKKAAAHLQAVGVEQACKDFKDSNGEFMHGQFYVFANHINGLQLCNPRSPQSDGKNTLTKQDARGKEFVRAYIEVAKTKGKGWHDYHHTNPVTEQVEKKSAYVELVGDIVVGCGIYKAESQPVTGMLEHTRVTRSLSRHAYQHA